MNVLLPFHSPHRPVPNEAAARSMTAAGLTAIRELAGCSIEEWADRLSDQLGRHIPPDMIRDWEDPAGPKPPAHWAVAAFILAGPAALDVASRLFLAP